MAARTREIKHRRRREMGRRGGSEMIRWRMRLHGQRPWYQDGPPEGAGPVGSPPSGAMKSPERRYPFLTTAVAIGDSLFSRRPGSHQFNRPVLLRQKARRIAGSSSGHTARGRGFMDEMKMRACTPSPLGGFSEEPNFPRRRTNPIRAGAERTHFSAPRRRTEARSAD